MYSKDVSGDCSISPQNRVPKGEDLNGTSRAQIQVPSLKEVASPPVKQQHNMFAGLTVLKGTSNAYVLDAGKEVGLVVINTGDELTAEHLATYLANEKRTVAAILTTDCFDRSIGGVPLLVETLSKQGLWNAETSKVYGSSDARALLTNPLANIETWRQSGHTKRTTDQNQLFETRNTFDTDVTTPLLPGKEIAITTTYTKEEFIIGDLIIRAVATPSASNASVSLFVEKKQKGQTETGRQSIAFLGELVDVEGDRGFCHSLGFLQKEYGSKVRGIAETIKSLDAIESMRPEVVAPSHGELSDKPEKVFNYYKEGLRLLRDAYQALPEPTVVLNGEQYFHVATNELKLETPHIPATKSEYLRQCLQCIKAEATAFRFLTKPSQNTDNERPKSVLIDWSQGPENPLPDELVKELGVLHSIIVSHAHDDHVQLIPVLLERYNQLRKAAGLEEHVPRISVSEVVERVVKSPESVHQLCKVQLNINPEQIDTLTTPSTIPPPDNEWTEVENIRYCVVPISGHSRYMNLTLVEISDDSVKDENGNSEKIRFCHVADSFVVNPSGPEGSDFPDGTPLDEGNLQRAWKGGKEGIIFPVPVSASGTDWDSYTYIAKVMRAFAPALGDNTKYVLLSGHCRPATDLLAPASDGTTFLDALEKQLRRVDRAHDQLLGGRSRKVGFGLDALDCEFIPGEITLTQEDLVRGAIDIEVQVPRPNGFSDSKYEGWGWLSVNGQPQEASLHPVTFEATEHNPKRFFLKLDLDGLPQKKEPFTIRFNIANVKDKIPVQLGDIARVRPAPSLSWSAT